MKNSPRIIRCLFKTFSFSIIIASALSTASALASPEMDRRYSLESIGALKSHDNVDGLFSDYVHEAIREYFSTQPRFLLQDLTRSDAVLAEAKIQYSKLIDDEQVLSKVARVTRSSTLLRTKIFKEGPRYRFTVDWLLAPKMEVLSSEVFYLDEPKRGEALGSEEIKSQLSGALDRLIRKIPFSGNVTGRDRDSVTLNVGDSSGIKKGDTLIVGTIEEVKRHPLLKAIVEWRIVQTGKIQVEQVDRGLTFGRVIEEEPSRPVARLNKLLQVIAQPDPVAQATATPDASLAAMPERLDPPRYGWISAGILAGNLGRQTSNAAGTAGWDGGGYGGGARAEAQLWLNRQWFVEGMLSYGLYGYSQTQLVTGAAGAESSTATLFQQRIGVGYSYLPGSDFFAAKSWVKLGTQSSAYTLARNASEQLNPITFSGLYLGLGGDLPLRSGWGAQMNLNFGLTNSAKETTGVFGNATSATHVDFYAGVFKQIKPRLLFRMGLNFTGQGSDYATGATISHRSLSITPSWVMLF
jgi:hypothetical protein